MRSIHGLLAALAFLLVVPGAMVGSTLFHIDAEITVHFVAAAAFGLLAVSVFDFQTPRWLTWAACVAASVSAVTYFVQGVSNLVANDALHFVAFQLLGQQLERVLPDVLILWSVGLLLTDSAGSTRILGFIVVTPVVLLELLSYGYSVSGGISTYDSAPILRLAMLLPFVWLPFECAKRSVHSREGWLAAARRRPLLTFFLLSYALTWVAVVPYTLGAFPSPMIACGPFVAAVIVTAVTGGWQDTRRLLLCILQWRVPPRWYAFALLPPLAVTLLAVYVNVQLGAPDPTATLLANLPSIVPIFLLMLLFPLAGGFGEELGWRGFALPRLLSRRSPLVTTLILGVLVGAWHAPLFIAGIYRPAWLHLLVIVTTTALFVVLYFGSKGSVLLAMLLHATMNAAPQFLFAPFLGPDLERALILFQVGLVALAAVVTALAWPRLVENRISLAPAALEPQQAAS